MKKILFVDDDSHVLDGLRNQLRKQRNVWHMEFAAGPQVAIAMIERTAFDVVISDMRMPGMDGAELLAYVKEHRPSAVRIILSGQADRDASMRSLNSAHQFLCKPCEAATLRTVLERACQLQELLSNSDIRSLVGRLDHLPSAPQTYWELTHAAERSESGVAEFSAIVERDPAMSLKVLQLVNSAYFGLPHAIKSVQQAVSRIGVELLKSLALCVHAFGTLGEPSIKGFSIERLQEHSLTTARASKLLATDQTRGAEAFAAAMVHDLGKLVLAMGSPEQYAQVLMLREQSARRLHDVELEQLGTSHAEVGAYLLGAWGLPFQLVESVAYHHSPSHIDQGSNEALPLLHIADALIDPDVYRDQNGVTITKLDSAFIAKAGLEPMLPEFRKRIAKPAA